MKAANPLLWLMLGVASFGFFGGYHAGIPFGNDDELFVHVNILNQEDSDLDDTKVRAFIYNIDGYASTNTFDVNDRSVQPKLLQFESDGWLEPDYYPVRVVVQNKDIRQVKHAWVWIG